MRDADAGDVSSPALALFGNDVAAVARAAFAIVEPYDIGELDDRSRVLHTCGVDELDAVGGGHVSLKPHERSRRGAADGVVQQQDPAGTSRPPGMRGTECGERAVEGYADSEFLAAAPFGESADVFGSGGGVVAGLENLDGEAAWPGCLVDGSFEQRPIPKRSR
jgi:hypothetical protein